MPACRSFRTARAVAVRIASTVSRSAESMPASVAACGDQVQRQNWIFRGYLADGARPGLAPAHLAHADSPMEPIQHFQAAFCLANRSAQEIARLSGRELARSLSPNHNLGSRRKRLLRVKSELQHRFNR